MLKIITYNCHGLYSSIQGVIDLCDRYDLIFLQEIWLFKYDLSILCNLHPLFEGFGCSAIDESNGIIQGRPYGGLGILIRKTIRPFAQFHSYTDSRLLGVTITLDSEQLYFISTYIPYQCNDNFDLYLEYIGKISALIDECHSSNIIILGDFNAAVGTLFESELLELCKIYKLVISDYNVYGRESGQYTYVSDSHFSTSWLDHLICNHDMNLKLSSVKILDKLPCSDHLPLSAELSINSPCSVISDIKYPSPRSKATFSWSKVTEHDTLQYRNSTFNNLKIIIMLPVTKCTDPNCTLIDHRQQIGKLYSKMCCALLDSSHETIPSKNDNGCRDFIVPGYNDYAKELHCEARTAYIAWKRAGRPALEIFVVI